MAVGATGAATIARQGERAVSRVAVAPMATMSAMAPMATPPYTKLYST